MMPVDVYFKHTEKGRLHKGGGEERLHIPTHAHKMSRALKHDPSYDWATPRDTDIDYVPRKMDGVRSKRGRKSATIYHIQDSLYYGP
jgi:hypothetical protein